MDGESKQLIEDCFLRTIVDPRTTNASIDPPPTKAPVKVELQVLRLSDDSQNLVMDTLKAIHGANFQLGDISKYEDKGSRFKKGYWEERGNLVIQGGCDYSNVPKTGNTTEDKFRMFAIMKLESYGFHKSHCTEALEHCKGDIDESLELLFSKYFPSPKKLEKSEDSFSENELLEIRLDEKSALESIYDKSFVEKEKNRVWQLKFKIDHLLVHSPSEVKKLAEAQKKQQELESSKRNKGSKPKKRKEKCWNFAKGKCRYGVKCLYSHTDDSDSEKEKLKTEKVDKLEDDPNWFYLEIRFPRNSQYPYEPPLVFLKTTCGDIPHSLCLRINRRLIKESIELTRDGMPCIYSIAELLQSNEEIENFINSDRHQFLDPKKSLFHVETLVEDKSDEIENLPSHYQKGSTGRSGGFKTNPEQLLKEDLNIIRRFMDKQNNGHYRDMLKGRKQLPAWSKMEEIIYNIENSQVLVISGETGCGKSTQVPQFILDNWLFQSSKSDRNKVEHVEIICTQPRRLSAIGVAERVADERGERIGNTVGYQIRLENKISTSTRLTFCTTGILLRRLQSDPMLESVTHVIVDEVHERSEESDFLLLILKDLMRIRSDLKVILMSATLNANLFSSYFGGVPVLDIPGRTFPVEQLFLEDILEKSGFVLEPDSQFCKKLKKGEEELLLQELEYSDVKASNAEPGRTIKDENLKMDALFARYSSYSKATCKTLYLMDPLRINPELIEAILQYIVDGEHEWSKEGTILIFLPGLAEIQMMHDSLSDSRLFGPRGGGFILVPLHSTLTNEEQGMVFKKAPKGKRKIVLSTNIAETSVTIDDCVFVIDCGQMKEKRFDSNRNMESLEVVWVSKANALQRKGRAGRVMPGVCIHLFTHPRFSNHILNQPVPEIHRIPLEPLLLRIKTLPNLESKDLAEILRSTIEPPSEENVEAAIRRLQDVGAFDLEQNLTPLGHHLSALPVDVRIGKLMLFGAIFQCLDSVLTIAACLSFKSPFVSPFSKRDEADNRKRQFGIANSDHLTVLNAYKKWKETAKRSRYAGQCFAEENFLSGKTLQTLGEIKYQFLELLVSIGFVPIDTNNVKKRFVKDELLEISGRDLNVNGENNRLLAAILCAALYPNVVKVLTPEKSFVLGVGGAVPKQPLPSELRFKTQQDGYVNLHPSSINSKYGHFSSPFLVYQEKVKTSRIFIRDCTMVPLLPLVLFSGSDVIIELHGGDFIISLEKRWIMLQASSHQVAEMMSFLRLELNKILEEKIRDPLLNLLNHENGKKIISTIVHLITKE